MSTRSAIVVLCDDGKFRGVYCHSDGYPSWVGRILEESYNSITKAEKLVALGDLSQLGPKLTPDDSAPHSFDSPQKDVVVAYGRDRNDPSGPTVSTQNGMRGLREVLKQIDHCGRAYVFLNDKWRFYNATHLEDGGKWKREMYSIPADGFALIPDAIRLQQEQEAAALTRSRSAKISQSYEQSTTVTTQPKPKTKTTMSARGQAINTVPFKSKTNPANSYEVVEWENGEITCSCPGWTRRCIGGVRECKRVQTDFRWELS